MTPTPVGMSCPECSRQKTEVHTLQNINAGGDSVTRVLIAMCVIAFLAVVSSGAQLFGRPAGRVYEEGALYGPFVSELQEYWRLVTSGFLHAGFIHLGFNMYLLWSLGQMLEPVLGRVRFIALYFVSLLGGALGALLLNPDSPTVGASGAVFGLMAAAFLEQRARGIDPMQTGIGGLILLNLGL